MIQQIEALNNGTAKYSDYMRPGFEYLKELIDKGYIDAEKAYTYEAIEGDGPDFMAGKTPIVMAYWSAANAETAYGKPNFNLQVIGFPSSLGQMPVISVTGYAVSANAEHLEEALDVLEVAKSDPDEAEENAEGENAVDENGEEAEAEAVGEGTGAGEAVDENGEKVEAEVVTEEPDAEDADGGDDAEEKKEKIIYYVTDERQQGQYINMFKAAKMDAVILTHNIDQPFVQQLESKNEGIKFMRIDADLTENFKAKTSKKAEKELEENAEAIGKLVKKALKKDKLTVKLEKLKNKKISSMLTISEESRRMQDMMKMYAVNGMDMGMFGEEGETLVLNASHPLVQYVMEHKEEKDSKMICEQLYDLAKIQNAPLPAEEMANFVARSNEIMMLLMNK